MFTPLKRFTLLLTLAGAFTVLAQLSSSAHAMCVYNKTPMTVSVDFHCGLFCENDWTMEAGDYKCRPNKGGLLLTGYIAGQFYATPEVTISVDAHGWIEMTLEEDGVGVRSYKQDGTQDDYQTYDPKSTIN